MQGDALVGRAALPATANPCAAVGTQCWGWGRIDWAACGAGGQRPKAGVVRALRVHVHLGDGAQLCSRLAKGCDALCWLAPQRVRLPGVRGDCASRCWVLPCGCAPSLGELSQSHLDVPLRAVGLALDEAKRHGGTRRWGLCDEGEDEQACRRARFDMKRGIGGLGEVYRSCRCGAGVARRAHCNDESS